MFKVFLVAWYWICSRIEGLFRGGKSQAKTTLEFLINHKNTGKDLSEWYDEQGYKWKPDPLRGIIDFESQTWVTITKKSGDCDDLARLSWDVLSTNPEYKVVARTYVYSVKGKGHVVVICQDQQDQWWLASNIYWVGPFDSMEAAAGHFYNDVGTLWFYVGETT
jgi:hypothetical protein